MSFNAHDIQKVTWVPNQQNINEVKSHKHLGIVFSNDCTWHEHLEYVKKKAWNRINVMRKLKFKLDRRSLQIIYFTFVRPLLEYADVLWDNCTQYEINDLEKIQNEAARIVTGATKLVSINSLCTETGWETLSSRRKKHKLILFYKIKKRSFSWLFIVIGTFFYWKYYHLLITKYKWFEYYSCKFTTLL